MSAMPPGYLICTHPRSGSTYFCQLLESTGKLGRPTEYFNLPYMRQRDADYPDDLAGQVQYLVDRSATANGVRAGKVFWFSFEPLVRQRMLGPLRGFKLIYLERTDKLAQALSISRALQSGKFTSTKAVSEARVAYSYADIRLRLARLFSAERQWRDFFRSAGITPVRCRYESLLDDAQSEIDRIARALGVEGPVPIDPSHVSLRVQRDARSSDWRERFLAEARQADPELLSQLAPAPAG